MNWYIKVLKKYADFSGRASRAEFWYFTLINLVVFATYEIIVVSASQRFINSISGMSDSEGLRAPDIDISGINSVIGAMVGQVVLGILLLAIFVPWLAVTIRRLQDTGRSGLYSLLLMVPVFGHLVLIAFLCENSQPMVNQYGPNPKDLSVSV
ncbi:MAG: DUF805 domain-containing protein [Armatimonadota bacterium]